MKTIIIYASTYGCTRDCAQELALALEGETEILDILADKAPDLDAYDQIILGGSIYMGQVQKKLKTYCANNLQGFLKKPIGLFLCCGLPENFQQSLENSFPPDLITAAKATECFGGELRTDRMNTGHRLISGIMKKTTAGEGKEPHLIHENITKLAQIINERNR